MFVRFRQAKTRLQASLIQNHWNDGRVRHEHITMLGVVDHPQTIPGRIAFWQRLHERLASLGNRVDAATQAKLLEAIHARIPMVTPDEQRALQLDNAKADARVWDMLAGLHADSAADHEGLIAKAEATRADIVAAQAKAAAEADRVKDRIARIERGENVDGGLGKPAVFDEQFLFNAGFTRADIEQFTQFNAICDAFGFDFTKRAIEEARDRAERSTLRALHRRIPDQDDE
jgi:hypothetical protein